MLKTEFSVQTDVVVISALSSSVFAGRRFEFSKTPPGWATTSAYAAIMIILQDVS